MVVSPQVEASFNTSLIAVPAIATVILFIRWVVLTTLLRPLAFRVLPITTKNAKSLTQLTTKEQETVTKFCKYVWHGVCYISMVLWCFKILISEEWGFSLEKFADLPSFTDDVTEIKIFFWVEAAWYCCGLIETILIEQSRKDFGMMVTHHIISVILTYGAYLWSVHRIGLLVTFEQDIGDIMLYIAKTYQKCYSNIATGKELPGQTLLHTIFLWLTGLTWFLTRNLSLGAICWGIWKYCVLNEAWRWMLFLFLDLLLVLQLIWGAGLYWMVWSQFSKGAFYDVWHDKKPESPQTPTKRRD